MEMIRGSTFGGDLKVTGSLTIKGSSAQNSEATSLMINSNGVVGTRELGSIIQLNIILNRTP